MPKGRGCRACFEDNAVPLGRGQPEGQAEVVEIGSEARPRIEGTHRALVPLGRGEQEGIRVDGRRQVVRGLMGGLGMQEGELREREETVRIQVDAGPPQRRQGALGVVLESLGQAGTDQHLRGRRTRPAGGEHAGREGAIDLLRVHAGHADRRRTGADQ